MRHGLHFRGSSRCRSIRQLHEICASSLATRRKSLAFAGPMECGSLPNAAHGAFALAVPRWQAAYFCGVRPGTGQMAVASRGIHGGLRDSVVIPLVADMAGGAVEVLNTIGGVSLLVSFVASVFSVFVRWRSVEGRERQQLKWFAYGAAVLMGSFFFLQVAGDKLSEWTIFVLIVTGLMVIPVSVGIAIMRYRLYDIDVLINRTLVYGVLTAMLLGIYFGGVTATQALFRTLTGQEKQPQLAIVVSTLLIAALFNPLRRRLQSFIDRRFYRSKYDAQKTLEAFSSKLRDETDLEALSGDLESVVRETMQPAHVSLWLRPETS